MANRRDLFLATPVAGGIPRRNIGNDGWHCRQDNLGASIAPTGSDDNTAGYSPGSVWLDVTAGKVYRCLVDTAAAAVWVDLTQPTGRTSVTVTAPTHTVAVTEDVILCDRSDTGGMAVSLPPGGTHLSKVVTIKDKKGDAVSNNVTATADGAETIDGSATSVIDTAGGALRLVFSGTEWSII